MVSALLMLHRVRSAMRYAVREEDFGTVFAVSTLTTTSVADPNLVLDQRSMKVFTVFYLLVGIGILVEILRRLGLAFLAASQT
jgi:hypothetical protein